MAQFLPKSRDEILERLIDRVVARSALNDLHDGAVGKQILAAVAREVEDNYFQTYNLLTLFDIDRAAGTDLDEVAKVVEPDGVAPRTGATRSTGTVRFDRATGPAAVVIPIGTQVAATAVGQSNIAFETTAEATMAPAVLFVNTVPCRAVEAGAGGNVALGAVNSIVGTIPGVDSVSNNAPNGTAFTGGLDLESDVNFRARIKEHLRTLARSTVAAIEYVARTVGIAEHIDADQGTPIQFLTNTDTLTVRRCIYSKVIENPATPGIADLYVDDGTGFSGVPAGQLTFVVTNEDAVVDAAGGERRVFTEFYPLVVGEPFTLHKDAGAGFVLLVEGVDYTLNRSTGQITLAASLQGPPAGPGTLGEDLRIITYTHHKDLVWAVARAVEGDGHRPLTAEHTPDPDAWPGWRAAGTAIFVRRPIQLNITVVVNIELQDGYTLVGVDALAATAVDNYLNGLGIGSDVTTAQIIEEIMRVDGVANILGLTVNGNDIIAGPIVDIAVADNELVRSAGTTVT